MLNNTFRNKPNNIFLVDMHWNKLSYKDLVDIINQ